VPHHRLTVLGAFLQQFFVIFCSVFIVFDNLFRVCCCASIACVSHLGSAGRLVVEFGAFAAFCTILRNFSTF
jgi:hypothetical protein